MSSPSVLDFSRWESNPNESELSFDNVPKKHSAGSDIERLVRCDIGKHPCRNIGYTHAPKIGPAVQHCQIWQM